MMLNKMAFAFAILGGVALAGCGGDDSIGGDDMAMSVTLHKVLSGNYAVSNLSEVEDSCMQMLTSTNYTSVQVTNDGAGHLDLGDLHTPTKGNPTYTPEGYSQGSGMFAAGTNTATTTLATHAVVTDGDCEYDLTRTNKVTATADNTISIDFTQARSNVKSTCTPVSTACTSHYTYTATKM